MVTEDDIRNALKSVKYPGYSRDIVSFGLVKQVAIRPDGVAVTLQVSSQNPEIARRIREEGESALKALPGIGHITLEVGQAATSHAASAQSPWANQSPVPGIRKVVAVASGKGGVGKSTVSVNLACALRHIGLKVGLLDCDIYGPSIPLMMGINEKPTLSPDGEKMVPPAKYDVKLMSIGFLVDGDQPVIWRGPMIQKTIQQFIGSVAWGTLDVLLVDLPPGTGDAQLSLCQIVPLSGGLVVTTPQEASLGVVRKGIAMFQKVNVPILGIVENMSYYTAPGGERVEIFGHGGGAAEAQRQNIPFLGEVPLYVEIREGGDRGMPVVISGPQTAAGSAFIKIANELNQYLA